MGKYQTLTIRMGMIECKETTSGVNDFEEGEESLESLGDDPMLEIVEPEELQSTEDEEEEQQIPIGFLSILDFIPDKLSLSDSVVAKAALKETIRDALSLLTPREEDIIRMRFGIDQETLHTLDEIGRKYGRTRERIRQIEKGALKKIATSEIGKILKSFC